MMFTRMYERKRYYGGLDFNEPIAGINKMWTTVDHEYKFGNENGRVFHLRAGKSEDDEISLEETLKQMRSQLCATDEFYFVIDERMVKAVSL